MRQVGLKKSERNRMAIFDKKTEPYVRQVDNSFEHVKNFRDHIEIEKDKKKNGDGDGWLEVSQEVINHFYPKGLGLDRGKPNTSFMFDGIHCYLTGTRAEVEKRQGRTASDWLGDKEQEGTSELKQ